MATFLAFAAAAYYAYVARNQLDVMNDTLREAHTQNVAQQRGLLSVVGTPTLAEGGDTVIRIRNGGRMPATISHYNVSYHQKVVYGKSFFRFRSYERKSTIAADGFYDLAIILPPVPEFRYKRGTKDPDVGYRRWQVSVSVFVSYDGGFKDKESLSYCSFLDPITQTWGDSCFSVEMSELSGPSPEYPDKEE